MCIPFGLILLEDFPLGMVANDLGIDEGSQIKSL